MFSFHRKSSDGITKSEKVLNFRDKFNANARKYQEEKNKEHLKETKFLNTNKINFINGLHQILDNAFPTYEQLEEISKKGKYGYILANSKGIYNTYQHYEYYEPFNWAFNYWHANIDAHFVINDIKFKVVLGNKKNIEPFDMANKTISMQYILKYLSNKAIDYIGKPSCSDGMVYYNWE